MICMSETKLTIRATSQVASALYGLRSKLASSPLRYPDSKRLSNQVIISSLLVYAQSLEREQIEEMVLKGIRMLQEDEENSSDEIQANPLDDKPSSKLPLPSKGPRSIRDKAKGQTQSED